MAVTNIIISQDNKYNGSDLLPVHSPLVFIVSAEWTTSAPDNLHVEIYDVNDTLLDTYKCIPFRDIETDTRQFAFIASEPIRSLMEKFDDTLQAMDTFVHIPEMTLQLRLKFFDPVASYPPSVYDEDTFMFIHGAAQFGSRPNFHEIFNNASDTYYGQEGHFVYVYYYNDAISNVIGINGLNMQLSLPLGAWNLDMNHTRSIAFAIPSGYTIYSHEVIIFEDDGITEHNLSEGGTSSHDGDSFELALTGGGYFIVNYNDFDGPLTNRGFINVILQPV